MVSRKPILPGAAAYRAARQSKFQVVWKAAGALGEDKARIFLTLNEMWKSLARSWRDARLCVATMWIETTMRHR